MKFVKIMYFDESSVADFMQIIAGGEIKQTTELISDLNTATGAEADIEAGISTDSKGLAKLFGFLSGANVNASAKANAGINYKQDKIVKNILENTLLADFINLLKNDQRRKPANKRCNGIKIFKDLLVYPQLNSFSYFMLVAPFFSMIDGDVTLPSENGNNFKLDIAKIEEAIDKGRGYYEFIAKDDNEEIILRFNITAFRNNYTMSDLPKMSLSYYAIYVGKIDKGSLSIEKEFEFGIKDKNRADYSGLSKNQEVNKIKVYDVILAGIEEENG